MNNLPNTFEDNHLYFITYKQYSYSEVNLFRPNIFSEKLHITITINN